MSIEDLQAIEFMHRHGGPFTRALAHAAAAANAEDLAKIKATWPELWATYANWNQDGQL